MTKNELPSQTVTVYDENGSIIGKTYPKRAKGLVKHSRATYVSDNEIRLNTNCPTYDNTEDMMDNITDTAIAQTNYLFFEPKRWNKHPDVPNSTADRFFINSVLDNKLVEVVSLGDWGYNWSEITNGMLMLEKNTEYHFVFWLNGGENDNSNELCQFQVMFSDDSLKVSESDWNNKLTYKLNRSYLKPLKKYKGWELYDIPFTTEDKLYTQMRFVAQRAPMTIMSAEIPETYSELPEVLDEFEEKRPQRHNIIFADGWPTNTWYATERLKNGGNSNFNNNPQFGNFDFSQMFNGMANTDEIVNSLQEQIMAQIKSELQNPSSN